jgi:hypothetical protein
MIQFILAGGHEFRTRRRFEFLVSSEDFNPYLDDCFSLIMKIVLI